MPEPLMVKLKRNDYIAIAELQDTFINMIYSFDHELVLHGGTAIWRCYSGNRFSSDIDGYIVSEAESRLLNGQITWEMERVGLGLRKITERGGTLYILASSGGAELRAELYRRDIGAKPVVVNYERLDGSAVSVRTLSAADLVLEKVETYRRRRYARDLFDIYQLIDRARDNRRLMGRVRAFMKGIEPPLEKAGLVEVVFSGAVPSFGDMVRHITGVANEVHG